MCNDICDARKAVETVTQADETLASKGGLSFSGGAKRGLLVLLLSASLLSPLPAIAQEVLVAETDPSLSESANQDLLLFWEEKELYVQTATRTAKPISQVAENMEVITAKDIADMNAHSVAEVLNRVPGLYVDFNAGDLNSTSLLHIQGSNERHVTVFVDGVFWNTLSGGNADVSSIPVQIIDRIEILKGPASSAWGSALGGVINIITKAGGDRLEPKGAVTATYGKRNTQDYNGELYGKVGMARYYLFGGRQETDGLVNGRDYRRNSFYGKVQVAPSNDLELLLSLGYSDPRFNIGKASALGITSTADVHALFLNGAFDYRLSPTLSIKGAAYGFRQKIDNTSHTLPLFDLNKQTVYDELTVGSNLKVVYTDSLQSGVVGLDLSYGSLEQTINTGNAYQLAGAPATAVTTPDLNKWAMFTNDTISVNALSITPGIRYDHNNVSGSFISPSLGLTYEFDEHVIGRASVARGFTSPPLSASSGGGLFAVPNPNLMAEYGWSYQAGVESALFDYLNLKGNLFRHDTRDDLVVDASNRRRKIFRNAGSVVRQGYELQAETAPIHNISVRAAHSFVHIDAPSQANRYSVNYSYQLAFKYDDRVSWLAQLAGNYVWWDLSGAAGAKYDSFVWDLNVNKRVEVVPSYWIEVFVNVHNLTNSKYYTSGFYPNASTWAEGGLKFSF